MGVDDLYYESLERGWDAPGKFVCADCVEDDFLRGLIEANLASRKCTYCGRGSRGYIAAPVESIMPAISSALHYYFNDPDSACVPYDKGYVSEPTTTTEEALDAVSLECQENLFTDIAGSFHNTLWTETAGGHWAGTHDSETLADSWKDFVHSVKHECRYFFFRRIPSKYSDKLSPLAVLEAVGRIANGLELINIIPSGTELFRARIRANDAAWEVNSRQLGPPPNELANAGRMNPAGISYFYLAKDQQTALAEVVNKPPCNVVCASFKTSINLHVLDLGELPAIPSIFDEEGHGQREWIYFLHHFIFEISQPVAKNNHEHIDYVASQIVSEYLAKEFRTTDGHPINGVTYPSTIRPGGINVVLFPPQKNEDDDNVDITKTGYEGFFEIAAFDSVSEIEFRNWNDLLSAIR